MLALTAPARRWEPKRLRLGLFSAAAQFVTTGRRRILRLATHWPWANPTGHHKRSRLPLGPIGVQYRPGHSYADARQGLSR